MLNASQQQQITQGFVLTRQLAKNISLLTHNITQLRKDILQEVEENPALEIKEEPSQDSLDFLSIKRHENDGRSKDFEYVEDLFISPQSLSDYLLQQLSLETDNKKEMEIGTKIIGNLDEHGFFQEDPFVVCKTIEGVTKQQVQQVLEIIQNLDPVGCATSGVTESLRVQIESLYKQEHFHPKLKEDLLACITLIEQSSKKNTPEDEITIKKELDKYLQNPSLQNLLHSITPYPTLAYNSHYDSPKEEYIVPDAVVSINEDQSVQIQVNNTIVPVLSISKEIEDATKSEDEKTASFANNYVQAAHSFIAGLKYRNSSLEKVVSFIAYHHLEFLLEKKDILLPLTRSHIAKKLNLNESTISRIISGKYIQTPRGIMEIKTLLSQKSGVSNVSGNQIKKEIQNILSTKIEKSLSDQMISELLQKKGITIARRTVAKYRKQLQEEHI